jgi:hypothetical protein
MFRVHFKSPFQFEIAQKSNIPKPEIPCKQKTLLLFIGSAGKKGH